MSTEEQLTLFAGDSPVSHSALPGSKEAQEMTEHSGRKCLESYGRWSQLGSLAKMFLESSTWNSTRCYLTWKIRGYSCQTFDLPACSLDAQHIRARIFLFPHTNSATLRDGTERGAQGRDHFQRSGNAIPAHDGPSQPMAHTDNRHWSREIKEVLGKQSGKHQIDLQER